MHEETLALVGPLLAGKNGTLAVFFFFFFPVALRSVFRYGDHTNTTLVRTPLDE